MTEHHRPPGKANFAHINEIDDALLGMEGLLYACHDLLTEPTPDKHLVLAVSTLLGFLHMEHDRAQKAMNRLLEAHHG